jgi:hypothetical protein
MADQQKNRGGPTPGTNNPGQQGTGPQTNDNAGTRTDRDVDRDRQNRDDPSRAPESGDRK